MHFYIPTKDDILGSDLIEDPDFVWGEQMQITCCLTLTHVYKDVITQYPVVCLDSLNERPLDVECLDLFLQVVKDTLEFI